MDLLPSEIARLVWGYLSDFDELKGEADAFLQKCPDLRELSQHLRRGGRACSRKVQQKTLQDHLNDVNKPAITTIEFDERQMINSVTSSVEELLTKQFSQICQKSDLNQQTNEIDSKLCELIERQKKFDTLQDTMSEQFSKMQLLLSDIVEQNAKLENGLKDFSQRVTHFFTEEKSAPQCKQQDLSNDFKYLEGKLKIEINSKSQYVTSFILNEFSNLKNLLETIVSSNYERISKSSNDLINTSSQFHSSASTSKVVHGQETPTSELSKEPSSEQTPPHSSPAIGPMDTPASDVCSQSPAYSELSLGDIISENARQDLNKQINQAVCLAANNKTDKYAEVIANALYISSNRNGCEIARRVLITPQKPSDVFENQVPQTPTLQDRGNNNFSLSFNLVNLIDDILLRNSPLKDCFDQKINSLHTPNIFPATPDISLPDSNSTSNRDLRASSVVKNFSDILMTPNPKEIEIPAAKEREQIESQAACSSQVQQSSTVDNSVTDESSLPVEPPKDQPNLVQTSSLDETTDNIVVCAPVFANHHMVTRSSPRHVPPTAFEKISPVNSPTTNVSVAPLNDLTMNYENVQETTFKKPIINRVNNRSRGKKFSTTQQMIRHSLGQQDTSTSQVQVDFPQEISSQAQVVQQGNIIYQINPPQTMICVNDLEGNTYLQHATTIDPMFHYSQQDGTTSIVEIATNQAAVGEVTELQTQSIDELPTVQASQLKPMPQSKPGAVKRKRALDSSPKLKSAKRISKTQKLSSPGRASILKDDFDKFLQSEQFKNMK